MVNFQPVTHSHAAYIDQKNDSEREKTSSTKCLFANGQMVCSLVISRCNLNEFHKNALATKVAEFPCPMIESKTQKKCIAHS